MNNLKTELLKLNIFENNIYLDKYIKLIEENYSTEHRKNSTQSHHIIPRYYFKMNNLDVDESSNNRVNLLFCDHIMAHYYLSLCSIGRYKYANIQAFIGMTGRKGIKEEERHLIKSLPEYQQLYEEGQKRNSELHKGKPSPIKGLKLPERSYVMPEETKVKISQKAKGRYKGDVGIHKGDDDKHVKPEYLSYYLELGYEIGRSDKYKKALSDGYNYNSKGMLGKNQSDYQKQRAAEVNHHPRNEESKQKQREVIRANMEAGAYVYMRNNAKRSTIKVLKENVQIYLDKGYHICNNK